MRLSVVTGVLAALLLSAAPGWSAEPITKRQLRDLPAAEGNRRVMSQVADLFETPAREPRRTAPVRPLDTEYFQTVPRTTLVKGLCRVDQLAVEFAPAGGGKGADQRSRASGFTASSQYAFAESPPASAIFHSDLHDNSEGDFTPRTAPCAKTSPDDAGYFTAASEEMAADGYLIFRRMLAEAPKADWPLECDLFPAEKDAGCVKVLAGFSPGSLWSVEPCRSDGARFPLARCHLFQAGDREFRIYSTAQASRLVHGKLVPEPFRILQVEMTSLVMFADSRID